LTAKIAERGTQVTGVDQSAAMIRQARQAYPAIRFEVGDARELTLEETFDAVFSNATLHWVKEAERAVEAIHRRLKPGGRSVAEFGGKGNIATLMNGFERRFQQLGLPWSNPWYNPASANMPGCSKSMDWTCEKGCRLTGRPSSKTEKD
jgi:trans-aconitate 2-methyltransferase